MHGVNDVHWAKKSVLALIFYYFFYFARGYCVEYSFYSQGDQVKIGVSYVLGVGFVQTWAT